MPDRSCRTAYRGVAMSETFEAVVGHMVGPLAAGAALPLLDPEPLLAADDRIAALGAAFLVALCGRDHPAHERALAVLDRPLQGEDAEVARFLRRAVDLVRDEVRSGVATDEALAARLLSTAAHLVDPRLGASETAEALWSLFFPEGVGILGHEAAREADLRARRTVRIREPNPHPISDPAREILLTSNVLLTVPPASRPIDALPYPPELARDLAAAAAEPQHHWFDHPIQVGVEPAANELLYGLRGLDEALAFEHARRGDGDGIGTVPCVLSVTVTHDGLRRAARPYVESELARSGGLRHLAVHAFTEADTDRIVEDVLAPAVDPAGSDGRRRPPARRVRRRRRVRPPLQLPEGDRRLLAGRRRSPRPRHVQDRPRPGLPPGGAGRRDRALGVRAPGEPGVGRPAASTLPAVRWSSG